LKGFRNILAKKKGFNDYKVINNVVYLSLTNRHKDVIAKTLIDLEDLEYIKSLSLRFHAWWNFETRSYYAMATKYIGSVNGKIEHEMFYLHKLIARDNENVVDHRNGNSLDNRRWNLVVGTAERNSKNRKDCNMNNQSGYRNVSWNKTLCKWVVQLQIDGKNKIFDEKFDTPEEANVFAIQMRNKYYTL
jgi:hypothetical protein